MDRKRKAKREALNRFFSVLYLILSSFLLHALDPEKALDQYVIDVWTAEQGLPQNSAYTIIQTDDGYLWFGTGDGLARFNGAGFKIFDNSNTLGMKNNLIWRLFKTRDGTLWVATQGSGAFLYRNGVFKHPESKGIIPDNLSITDFSEDSRGRLWISGEGKRLFRKTEDKIEEIRLPGSDGIREFRRIYFDRSDNLWIASSNGLFRFTEGRFRRFTQADGLSSENVYVIFQDSSGRIWIGTDSGGINRFDGDRFSAYTTRDGLPQNDILNLYEDNQKNIWVGTRGGICRIHEGKFDSFTARQGLSSNTVMSFYEDREGGLWVGTGFGVNRFRDGNITTMGMRHGFPTEHIWSVYEDSRKRFWIGTHGSGVVRMEDGNMTVLSSRNGLPNDVVRCTLEDRRGRIWIGTYGGLSCIENGKFRNFDIRDGLSNSIFRSIIEDRNGRIWFGTTDGLNYYENGLFHQVAVPEAPRPFFIFSLFEDREGGLWVGSRQTIIHIQGEKKTLFNEQSGFSGDQVFSFCQDTQGRLWIATSTGLFLYRDGKFRSFTTHDGLPNNVINIVLNDTAGNLWMSSNRGIIRLPVRQIIEYADGKADRLNPDIFGLEDGMKTTECNSGPNGGCIGSDGKAYFSTLRGVAVVNPGERARNSIVPPVVIEEIYADGRMIPPYKSVSLPAGTNRLEFHFAALSFVQPAKVRFQYMLEGMEKKWVQGANRRDAYYTNLPPGKYTFRVIACNNDGVWNQAGAAFKFDLQPFFHQTGLFYSLCIFALALTGFGIYRLRISQLKAREKKLMLLVEERTKDLNQALEKVERLSMTDSLSQLPNRRNFEIIINQEWKRCSRESQPLSLLMIDIDFFKKYNDTYGHLKGDDCLKKVATAIQRCTSRAGDFVARLGGEEFVVLFPNTDGPGAMKMTERIRSAVEEEKIEHKSSSIAAVVTISLGVATVIPEQDSDYYLLIAQADQALYLAKREGRNRVHEYHSEQSDR